MDPFQNFENSSSYLLQISINLHTEIVRKFFFSVIRVLILFANFDCICSKHGTFSKILQTVRSYFWEISINLSLNPITF